MKRKQKVQMVWCYHRPATEVFFSEPPAISQKQPPVKCCLLDSQMSAKHHDRCSRKVVKRVRIDCGHCRFRRGTVRVRVSATMAAGGGRRRIAASPAIAGWLCRIGSGRWIGMPLVFGRPKDNAVHGSGERSLLPNRRIVECDSHGVAVVFIFILAARKTPPFRAGM